MFIRQVTKSGAKGRKYIYHRLVETVRTEKGPRQRTILNLGALELSREKWSTLVKRIEANLAHQISFYEADAEIESLAYYYAQRILSKDISKREFLPAALVLLNTLEITESRTIGAEGVGLTWLRYLKLDDLFAKLGFNRRQQNLAILTIIAHLVLPGGEQLSQIWARDLSGLGEILGDNFKRLSKNSLHRIADRLCEYKEKIEHHLAEREQDLFKLKENIILYDLTNTYFESEAIGNNNARFNRSKVRHGNSRLITLGIVVDEDGFLKNTRIFPGNQGEPETLREMILELAKTRQHQDIPITVVLTTEMATEENLRMLRGAGFHYIVVFCRRFSLPGEGNLISIAGEEKQLVEASVVEEGDEKVLYLRSQGNAKKEHSIESRFKQRLERELDLLAAGLTQKNKTKHYDKVIKRIGRLKAKYKRVSSYYKIHIEQEGKFAVNLTYEQKFAGELDENNSGGYCLRTNRRGLDKETILHIYKLICRIERRFQSLMSRMGFHLKYNQRQPHIDAQLFISVLAYHLLNCIEHRLQMCGDYRSWDRIRTILSNHTRITVMQRDKKNQLYRARINTTSNEEQRKIYRALLVKETMLTPKMVPGSNA